MNIFYDLKNEVKAINISNVDFCLLWSSLYSSKWDFHYIMNREISKILCLTSSMVQKFNNWLLSFAADSDMPHPTPRATYLGWGPGPRGYVPFLIAEVFLYKTYFENIWLGVYVEAYQRVIVKIIWASLSRKIRHEW